MKEEEEIKAVQDDRRHSKDERRQKDNIREKGKNVQKKNAKFLSLSLEDSEQMSSPNSKVSKRFRSDGKLVPSKDDYNHYRDSKAMDYVLYYRNKKTDDWVDIYFFCKYTKEPGGYQESIMHEISVTKDCIDKNEDKNVVVIFMLEGEFWESSEDKIKEAGFDNKKTFYAKTENLEEVITSILVDRALI